jgi:hypothetical protein
MYASFLTELLAAFVATLPRIFLLGAPVLLVTIVLAAFADAHLPGSASRGSRK